MSAETVPTDSKRKNGNRVWKNPTVIAAIIAAIATISAAVITTWLSRERSAPVEANAVEVVQVDSMDSLVGWTAYTDDLGSTLGISSKPGRTDSAIELLFDLQESGWVGLTRTVSPGLLAGSDGIAFYLRGSGEPNTVELKLLYPIENDVSPVFSVNWHASSATDDWVRLEAYFDQFTCWEETGCDLGEVPDPALVARIDFAISHKLDDVPGVGMVLLDSVEALHR